MKSRIKSGFYMACFGKLWHGLVAALVFFCLFSLVGQKEWKNYAIERYDGTSFYEETNWTLRENGEILETDLRLPQFRELQGGKQYSLSTVLTYDGSRDTLPYAFFYIHHMYCQVFLDGEPVGSYLEENIRKMDKALSPGNVYMGVPLPDDCQGMTFEIRFTPSLREQIDYELPNTRFGDYPTMVHNQFLTDLPHNLAGALTAFLGVLSILFATMALSGGPYSEGMFIGIFSLVFSLYNLTECPFNLYFISNPYYTYLLNYTTFSLIPVSLLAYLREKFRDPLHRRICLVCSLGGLGLLIAEWVLHFTGVMDMREFLKFVHAEYLIDLFLVLVMLCRMQDPRSKKALFIQILPVFLGIFLDGSAYYLHWDIANTDVLFSSIGIVLFLLIELRHVWRSSIDIYTDSIRSRYYQEMALEDQLTGVGNRRAFEEEKNEILTGQKKFRTILVASADVNDLKLTNDTMGHAEGDYLIRSTAQVLSSMTEGCGRTFRTGGDEFILLLYDVSEQEFEEKQDQARVLTRELNQSGRAFLSIALGFQMVEGLDIDSAVQKADRKMYVDKSHKKEYLRKQYPDRSAEIR